MSDTILLLMLNLMQFPFYVSTVTDVTCGFHKNRQIWRFLFFRKPQKRFSRIFMVELAFFLPRRPSPSLRKRFSVR